MPFPAGLKRRPARHIEAPSQLAKDWLERWLLPGEHLLVWLRVRAAVDPERIVNQSRGAFSYFVLTEQRSGLVWVSALTQPQVTLAPREALRLERDRHHTWIRVGQYEWTASARTTRLFAELVAVNGLPAAERLREVARLNWLHLRPQNADFVHSALQTATDLGDIPARFASLLLALESGSTPLAKPLSDLVLSLQGNAQLPAHLLADIWQAWAASAASGRTLVRLLRAEAAEPWALELHRRVYRSGTSKDLRIRLEDDLQLAEHLLSQRQPSQARELLEPHVQDHDGSIAFTAPPDQEELQRTRLYESLAQAGTDSLDLNVQSLVKLVQLRPLDAARAGRLAQHATADLRERSRSVVALLAPGGVFSRSPDRPEELVVPLSAPSIMGVIRHPLGRGGSDVLTALKTLVAAVPIPDRNQLTDFCQQLSPREFPAADLTLREACLVLGVSEVTAFVSRGDQGVGIRGFEQAPPFILIGGCHLDPSDPQFMSVSELRFALGAEVCHLRLGHTRVTNSDFWAGALMRTGEGVELLASLLPALTGWRLAGPLQRSLAKLPPGILQRVAASAIQAGRALRKTPESHRARAPLSAELSDATRMFQLTADRAGLLLCRDLQAAVRSMLRVRLEHLPLLTLAQDQGLAAVLATRSGEELLTAELHLRIGALIAFYLSEHYSRLCSELTEAEPCLCGPR